MGSKNKDANSMTVCRTNTKKVWSYLFSNPVDRVKMHRKVTSFKERKRNNYSI